MSASARVKGHSFERTITHMIDDDLGIRTSRILDQYREGNLGDIELGPFIIECKRYAKGAEPQAAWWSQAGAAGEHMNLIPILVFKFDYRQIQAVVPLYLIAPNYPKEKQYTAQVSWDTLMMLIREDLNGD